MMRGRAGLEPDNDDLAILNRYPLEQRPHSYFSVFFIQRKGGL